MANLVNGKLVNEPIAKQSPSGEFVRADSAFRNYISPAEAEPNRYHLFVSYACPWAHRTLITRNIKKLQRIINVSVSEAFMGEKGWTFSSKGDPETLASVYVAADPVYTGKVSVPVLWDKKNKTIVNNESSEIIRIFNTAFDDITHSQINLYPERLRERIDTINSKVYNHINNGVYKTGFATTQKAYESSFTKLFKSLDEMEKILGENAFLAGDYFTEADIRLFTTLLRFDPVYYIHFKCNWKRIEDYPNLYNYMKAIYQMEEVKSTCRLDHIKQHYYLSHCWINPNRIVPKGPEIRLDEPHNRGQIKFWLNRH